PCKTRASRAGMELAAPRGKGRPSRRDEHEHIRIRSATLAGGARGRLLAERARGGEAEPLPARIFDPRRPKPPALQDDRVPPARDGACEGNRRRPETG